MWFTIGRKVNSDWKVDSVVSIITPEGTEEARGKVIEFSPYTRLFYTWEAPEDIASDITTVVFELQEMGTMTKVTILHDIDADSAKFKQAAAGCSLSLLLSALSVQFMKQVETEYLARVGAIMSSGCVCTIPVTSFVVSILTKLISLTTILCVVGGIGIVVFVIVYLKRVKFE